MDISNRERANVLTQALPYIQKFHNRIVVVKYGGNAMISKDLKSAVMSDIVLLSLVGVKVVLVHGGGPEIDDMLNKIGKESRFVNGLRYTDQQTMDIVQMVLAGKVNKELVAQININGGNAVGLCGIDGNMIKAKKYEDADIGLVGEICEVNTQPIMDVLEKGYIPVISTIGFDCENSYNINADTAASKIAAALEAEKLILMTDIKGLLENVQDEDSLITKVKVSEVLSLKNSGIIKGGMLPKIDCCVEAVRRGVASAHIIDGRIEHSILIELLSDQGIGTMFTI